jgi:ligand-binding sensor domain-containing protein
MLLLPLAVFSQAGGWIDYNGKEMISRILNDGENLWIAANSGLLQLNKETEAVTSHELGLSDLPRLRNLAKDSEGNLWITTQRNGIVKYDGQRILEHYNTSTSGLANNQYCMAIAFDPDHNKWIGSLLYLNKFDGSTWQAWTTPQSAVASYWMIYDLKFDRNGDLWLGGASPEWCFAKFTGGEIQPVPEVINPVHKILIDSDNNKWLACLDGLIKYDGKEFVKWNVENSALPANDLYDIKQDASGNLWLASNKYLVRFDGREFTSYPSPLVQENNRQDFIYCIELDEGGNIWLGTKLSGLFKFTQAQGIFHSVSTPTAIQTVTGKNTDNDFSVHSTGSELSIHFQLTDAAKVSLSVFDLQGREVAALLNDRYLDTRNYHCSANLKNGIYLVRYIDSNKTVIRKISIK